MFYNAGVVFRTARLAYERAIRTAGDNEHCADNDGIVATTFAALAAEAAINELPRMLDRAPAEPRVAAYVVFADQAEAARCSVKAKYDLASRILARAPFRKGEAPYQDFALLIDIRDEIVHHKPGEEFRRTDDGDLAVDPRPLLARIPRGLLLGPGRIRSGFLTMINTPAMARWSCNVAAAMVATLPPMAPEGFARERVGMLGDAFQPIPSPDTGGKRPAHG